MPGLKKGAFVVGAKFGRGFVSCRTDAGWSAPAGIRVEGGSVGFQIGGTEIDVVLAIMNKRGVDRLLSNKFTLGADASVAAGPVGRTAAAQTDAMMTAEILSWSRSRGVFAGVALEGATLRGDDDANRDLYGKRLEMKEIVAGRRPPFRRPPRRSIGREVEVLMQARPNRWPALGPGHRHHRGGWPVRPRVELGFVTLAGIPPLPPRRTSTSGIPHGRTRPQLRILLREVRRHRSRTSREHVSGIAQRLGSPRPRST